MPSLELLLKPVFDQHDSPQHIDISMTWDSLARLKGDVLLHHLLARSGVPTSQYTADDIQVQRTTSDERVSLYAQDKKLRDFYADTEMSTGKLVAKYQAKPRHVDEFTKCGPQIALEKEDSGMSAAGMAILLRPAGDETFDITIDWDLSASPPGSRSVCSFGEGRVATKAKAVTLDECFFEVGAVKSFPPSTIDQPFGLYWLDEPTLNASALGRQLETVVPQAAAFFEDEDPLFRIFIRRNVQKCTSGRGLHRGFVFAWNSVVPRDSDGISEFLFHEIVHNWPRLGFYTGGPEDLADGWFNEGIAEYYSLVLPFRFGIFSRDEFIRRMNNRLSNYYTNPDRAVVNKDVPSRFWHGGHINRIPYQRGFMYFLQLAYQLNKAKKRSIDELMNEMIRLRLADEPHHIKTWLSLIEAELGPSTLEDYERMSNAELIILPEDVLDIFIDEAHADWTLRREDQEEFFLGFPEECLTSSPRVVKDLDPTSRAAQAGVWEGDQIIQKYSYMYDAENWDKRFSMTVKREDGDLEELSWWPRSWTKVESYQLVRRKPSE